MGRSPGRQALGREIKRALSARGLSVAAASRRMQVEPKRLYRWINGEVSPRLDEIERLANAIQQDITLHLGPDTKAPPPKWAEEMQATLVGELRKNRQLIEALAPADIRLAAERVIAQLEARLPPDDAAQDERNGSEGQDAVGLPGQGPGSHHGQVLD